MAAPPFGGRYRFREYDLDVPAYALRRNGRPVRLERQPMDLLILLVERRGQLVSRADIIDRLWGPDVFVDVETGVHTAIRKVRQALRDSPHAPACVETVPGRGYRFIAPVEEVVDEGAIPGPHLPPDVSIGDPPKASTSHPSRMTVWARMPVKLVTLLALGLLAIGSIAGMALSARRGEPPLADSTVRLAVLPFANLSGDPARAYIADGLAEETIASLGQVDPDHLRVIARTSTLAYRETTKAVSEIGREHDARHVLATGVPGTSVRRRSTSRLKRWLSRCAP